MPHGEGKKMPETLPVSLLEWRLMMESYYIVVPLSSPIWQFNLQIVADSRTIALKCESCKEKLPVTQ